MKSLSATACAVLLVGLGPGAVTAQQCGRFVPASIDGDEYQRARAESLLGQMQMDGEVLRRASALHARGGFCKTSSSALPDQGLLELRLLPVMLISTYNSTYPRDVNNGALWAGKGASSSITIGLRLRVGPLSAALAPTATYSTNADFATVASDSYSQFANPWAIMDAPQRFGTEPVHELRAGQSYARLDYRGLAAGVSSEDLWWGPMQSLPLLLGTTAGGFEHIFAGTSRPVSVGFGDLTTELIWGRLRESKFFDTNTDNDRHLLAGVVVGFQPRGLRGLSLGLIRVRHVTEPKEPLGLWELLRLPYSSIRTNLNDNQLLSVFARLALIPGGFEVFGEWARDDAWEDAQDLIQELDHSRAYAIGFQKVFEHAGAVYRIHGEQANLVASNSSRSARGTVFFYTNNQIPQGHSERGQLLGAWTGPGSNTQILGVEQRRGSRALGVFAQRVRFNTDAYIIRFAPDFGEREHDIELSLGANAAAQMRDLQWSSGLTLSWRSNRQWLAITQGNDSAELNVSLELRASWRPSW